MTNGDRIRSMTDEEIAEFIIADSLAEKLHFCQNKPECDALILLRDDGVPEENCAACAVYWLKKEANT